MARSLVDTRLRSAILKGFLASLAAIAACRPASPSPTAPDPSPVHDAPQAALPSGLAPAELPEHPQDPPPTALEVPGYHDAVVVAPHTTGAPRPILVAVHGNYDHVEPFCATWSRIASGWPFVLCPRGQPRRDAGPRADRWTFGWNARDLEREIQAGQQALRRQFGAQVAEGPVVFAGFSLGAILGAELVLRNPSRYPRAVLVEGGTTPWSLVTAKRFGRKGGRKVLFACGQEECLKETRAGLYWLDVVGVDARTAFAGSIGHTYEGIVADELTRTWGWLTEGDARWPLVHSPGPLACRNGAER